MIVEKALRRVLVAWRLRPLAVQSIATKNLTRVCRDRRGQRVFVKCAPNPHDTGVTREASALAWVARSVPQEVLRVPKVVAFAPAAQVLALEWVAGPSLYTQHRRRSRIPLQALAGAAAALGALHRTSAGLSPDWAPRPAEALVDCFIWTRPAFATRLSIDGMRLIGSLQADTAAMAGLIELAQAPAVCLIHGDAKALNVLVPPRGPPVWLDWELAQAGDPAQDLGSLAADVMRCHVAPELDAERLDARALKAALKAIDEGYGEKDDALERRARLWTGAHLLFYAHAMVLHDGVFHRSAARLLLRARALLSEAS